MEHTALLNIAKNMRNKIIISTISFILLFSGLLFTTASATGLNDVKATLSPTTISTATVMTLTFTPQTALATGSKILVSWTGGTFTGGASLVDADVTVSKTGDANFTSSTESSFTLTGFTSTLTTGGNLNTTNPFSITIGSTNKLTNPGTAQNIQISVTTQTSGGSTIDYGAGIASVGGADQIQVTASISNTLSFNIRDSADTTSQTTCGLGTLTTGAIANCQYRLKVATNSAGGFTVSYKATGGLTNGTYTFAQVGSGESTPGNSAAGTESYGANIQAGSVTAAGATVSSSKTCSTNCTTTGNAYGYQNASTPVSVYTSNKGNNPGSTDTTNTALVTHLAAISSTTAAGNYTSTVTYSIVATF